MPWNQIVFYKKPEYVNGSGQRRPVTSDQCRQETLHEGPFEYAKSFIILQTDWDEVDRIVIEDKGPCPEGGIVKTFVVVNEQNGIEFRPFIFYDEAFAEFDLGVEEIAGIKLQMSRGALMHSSASEHKNGYNYQRALEALRQLRSVGAEEFVKDGA